MGEFMKFVPLTYKHSIVSIQDICTMMNRNRSHTLKAEMSCFKIVCKIIALMPSYGAVLTTVQNMMFKRASILTAYGTNAVITLAELQNGVPHN